MKNIYKIQAVIMAAIMVFLNLSFAYGAELVEMQDTHQYVYDVEKIRDIHNTYIDKIDLKMKDIGLTPEEIEFINSLKGREIIYEEYGGAIDNDSTIGISEFTIDIVNKTFGLNIVKREKEGTRFSDTEQKFQTKQIDLAGFFAYGKNVDYYENKYEFTAPICSQPLFIIGDDLYDGSDIRKYSVALSKNLDDVKVMEEYGKFLNIGCEVLAYDEARKKLLSGEIEYYICEPKQLLEIITNSSLKYKALNEYIPSPQYEIIALNGEYSRLISAMDKLFSYEWVSEYIKDYSYKVDAYNRYQIFRASLTNSELRFLRDSEPINTFVYNLPTITEQDSNGEYYGYVPDVLNLISEISGLEFSYVSGEEGPYEEILEQLEDDYDSYIVPFVMDNYVDEVNKELWLDGLRPVLKTEPYFRKEMDILKLFSTSKLIAMDDLRYSKMGYNLKSEVYVEQALNDLLNMLPNTIKVFEGNDALTQLKEGTVSYCITMPGTLAYIERMKDTNINSAIGTVGVDKNKLYNWSMIANDTPGNMILVDIINKAQPVVQSSYIDAKWFNNPVDYTEIISLQVLNQRLTLVIAILTILAFVYYIFVTKKNHKILENLVSTDYLTKLYNRTGLNRDLENKDNFYYILIDINKFRQINEIYGTYIADAILIEVANRLTKLSEEIKCSLYRIEGDKFVVLVDYDNELSVEDVAVLIQKSLQPKYEIGTTKIRVTFSIGVTDFEYAKGSTENLVYFTKSMVEISKKNKNKTQVNFFNDKQKALLDDILKIEKSLLTLEKENIVPYYQAFTDVVTGKTVGCEVLCRYNIDGKIYGAYEFIPIAQRLGVLNKVDKYLLVSTINTRQKMLEENLIDKDFYFSINISAQFLKEISVEYLKALKIVYGIEDFNFLQVEILEELITQEDIDTVLSMIESMDITVAVDDFSAGHSSLTRFFDFDFRVIKIDRLLLPMVYTEKSYALYESVVQLLKRMNIKIVAEGVETKEQLDFLKVTGVDVVQGYYFSKAIPYEEFLEYLKKTM